MLIMNSLLFCNVYNCYFNSLLCDNISKDNEIIKFLNLCYVT